MLALREHTNCCAKDTTKMESRGGGGLRGQVKLEGGCEGQWGPPTACKQAELRQAVVCEAWKLERALDHIGVDRQGFLADSQLQEAV